MCCIYVWQIFWLHRFCWHHSGCFCLVSDLVLKAGLGPDENETVHRHNFDTKVKHLVQAKIKMAYNNYLENILGLSKGGDDTAERNSGFTSKKLFSLIKNARQDTQGVSPLKDPSTNATFSQNKEKANILNRQFQSVFSQLSPLKLGKICTDKLQFYFNMTVPINLNATTPQCLEFV